jgi:hypothetical protein
LRIVVGLTAERGSPGSLSGVAAKLPVDFLDISSGVSNHDPWRHRSPKRGAKHV